MNDISRSKALCWCDRLSTLMIEKNYTQKSFLTEYKKKYGGGTQANISRWMRVGSKVEGGKIIGFPTYETMVNLADFFGVSVAYLTGETDYESYELEQVCEFLGVDQQTVTAIKSITSGNMIPVMGKYKKKDYQLMLHTIITADAFPVFLDKASEYVDNINKDKFPLNSLEKAYHIISEDVRDLAVQCMDYTVASNNEFGEIDDFKENNVEPTEDLLVAVQLLNTAIDYDFGEYLRRKERIKLSKYELIESGLEIIKELEQ